MEVWGARPPALALLVVLVLAGAATIAHAAGNGSTQLITRPSGDAPVPGNGTGSSGLASALSDGSVVGGRQASQDGRYVVFVSEADDLSGDDNDAFPNVYVRDTVTNTTELVSRATGAAGTGGAGTSDYPSISDDGTRVAFHTDAQLAPADTDGFYDIYIRDLVADTTTLVPVTVPGHAFFPSLDEDGSHVGFDTEVALDAVNDNNAGAYDVYVWSVAGGTFELASRLTGAATAALTGNSFRAALSDDAAVVAFETESSQLDAGDTNGLRDIAVRRLSTHASAANTTLLASRATGVAGTVGGLASTMPALSGDGTRVAYVSSAANLVAGDTNGDPDVFRRRLDTNVTLRVSLTDGDAEIDRPEGSNLPSISDDGARVAFTNYATGVAPDDGILIREKVYVRVVGAGATVLASRADDDGASAVVTGAANAISGDGLTVAFASTADETSAQDDDSQTVHVHQRRLPGHASAPDTTIFLDRPSGTDPFTGTSDVDTAAIHAESVSWDGRYVAFASDADNVVPGQDNAFRNGFVRDTLTGATELVNAGLAGGPVSRVVLSADGRAALFVFAGKAYVRDLDADTNTLVSRADGVAGAEASVFGPNEISISRDGRHAAFATSDQLEAADTNAVVDLYVRDVAAAETTLVSLADDEQVSDGASERPSLDWDGSRVAFQSDGTNLIGAGGDTNGKRDVFVRDLAAATTTAASRADGAAGTLGNGDSTVPSIDGDGTHVAFATTATNLGGAGGSSDVLVRDLAAADTTSLGIVSADGQPSISDDGNRVAFVTDATLSAGDAQLQDVYVRDLGAATNTLASRGDGTPGPGGNALSGGTASFGEGPAVSGDGNCVAFPSLANNLDPDWAGNGVQLGYLRVTGSECPDATAPETTIDAGPAGATDDITPTFEFSAGERRATLECAVDGAPFAACTSPTTTAALAEGAHTFRARAIDFSGNTDATPAERAFTVDLPDPPAPPAPTPPAPPVTAPSVPVPAPAAKLPAKLKVLRAGVDDGVLDMLVEITSNAKVSGATLAFEYESSGRITKFTVPVASTASAARWAPRARAAEELIQIRKTLPSTQPKDTGIVEIAYAGNATVAPDEVRVRAADGKALLVRKNATLTGGRLKVDGTISKDARGVVRVRLDYDKSDGSAGFLYWNATISSGSWKVDQALTGDAAKGGYVSIQFTGYEKAGMRGEQTGKAVP